jgi:predicted O-methyltransferase YrrM
VSTLYLAAALRDNGGGRLITTEFESSKVARARASLAAAGVSELVEIREGALIVADNANWSPEYLAKVRAPTQGYMSVPFAEDVELSIKVH